MAHSLWLDNNPAEVHAEIQSLLSQGHQVSSVTNERDCIQALLSIDRPSLLIQDLNRPNRSIDQVPGGQVRQPVGDIGSAGWRFYQEVLRPYFPSLPVLICTLDDHFVTNQRRADDFNLSMTRKGARSGSQLNKLVDHLLAQQRPLIAATSVFPALCELDFQTVNARLVEHLAKRPQDLAHVSWATFESLIARLLEEMGYEVERTPLTRDGGVDIWALKKSCVGDVLYAIDAKKYAPSKILGPEPVRAIHGVAAMTGASVGMIVTTGRFGPSAKEIEAQYRYRLSLKEHDDVVAWLRAVSGSGDPHRAA